MFLAPRRNATTSSSENTAEPALRVKGLQIEVIPTGYEGLDDVEAERRALEDMGVMLEERAGKE